MNIDFLVWLQSNYLYIKERLGSSQKYLRTCGLYIVKTKTKYNIYKSMDTNYWIYKTFKATKFYKYIPAQC